MQSQSAASRADMIQRLADKSLLIALGITFVVAILLGVTNGWARGATTPYKIGWALFAIAVVLVEFGAIKKFVHENNHGHAAIAWMALGVGILGFVISTFATFNSATANLDQMNVAAMQKADSYGDSRAAQDRASAKVEADRRNVDTLRAGLAASVPKVAGNAVPTLAAAEHLVAKAKSDRFWNRTSGCTETQGRDTSKFCNEFREASAAVATLATRDKATKELADAETALATSEAALGAASAVAGKAPPVTSKESPFVRTLVRLSGIDKEDAALIEAGLPSVILQAFLMLLGLISAGAPKRMDEVDAVTYAPRPQMVTESQRPINLTLQNLDPFGSALTRLREVRAA
jgi:hypothetical protein